MNYVETTRYMRTLYLQLYYPHKLKIIYCKVVCRTWKSPASGILMLYCESSGKMMLLNYCCNSNINLHLQHAIVMLPVILDIARNLDITPNILPFIVYRMCSHHISNFHMII